MDYRTIIVLALALLASCSSNKVTGLALVDSAELSPDYSDELYVDPASAHKARAEYVKVMRVAATRENADLRTINERYVDLIGSNGLLDGIEEVWDPCHVQGHDIGKVLYAKTKNINKALRACSDRCSSGCMHGVLMEAFTKQSYVHVHEDGVEHVHEDEHVEVEQIVEAMNEFCFDNDEMSSYGPGECAHGTGHALMYLSGYDIPTALEACKGFDNKNMEYFCATGGYMEYVLAKDPEESKTQSLFYPCETKHYPGACMINKVGLVAERMFNEGKDTDDIIEECKQFEGITRLGCFNGLGLSHSRILGEGKMKVKEVCKGSEEEQTVCIEGALEFAGKYFEDKIPFICDQLSGKKKEICLVAGSHDLYSLDKDLKLYVE